MAKKSRDEESMSTSQPEGRLGVSPCPHCAKPPTTARTITGGYYVICINTRCKENPSTKDEYSLEFAVASWNAMVRARLQEMHDQVTRKSKEGRMAKKTTTTKVNRDAGTGKFVTEKYTQKHKGTTVTETVKKPTTKKKK